MSSERAICGALGLATLWLAGLLSETPTEARSMVRGRAPSIRLADPGAGGMVALVDGSVVLWGQGRIQIRSPTGAWAETAPLAWTWISQVVPDGAGLLVLGEWHSPPKEVLSISHSVVLAMDRQGLILERWDPRELILSVASADGRRWAIGMGKMPRNMARSMFDPEQGTGPIIDNLMELMPHGVVEKRGLVEMHAQAVTFSGGIKGNSGVDCVPTDIAKETYHYPYCFLVEPGGWRRVGFWTRLPFACGRYLVEVREWPGDDLPTRGKQPDIVVRRLDNGEVAGQKRLAAGQAVACGAPGELLVGGADVRGLSLPALAPLWRAPVRQGRVVAVVRSGDKILAATASGAVVTLVQPTPAQPTPDHATDDTSGAPKR